MKLLSCPWARTLWPWLLVLAAALLSQIGAWQAAFYMDDFHHIVMRAEVIGTKPLEFDWIGRFLTHACWRGIYLLFGPSPVAFHGFNWFLHGLVAFTSLGLLRSFVRLGPESICSHAESLAFWGALLFAVHPLCVEPVHYAAQTTILLATLLSMLACVAFLKWRDGRRLLWGVISVGLVLLAGMAKEPGFFHATILIFFTARLGEDKGIQLEPKSRLLMIAGIGLCAIVFTAAWFGLVLSKLGNFTELGHHWLTQARVMGEYVSRMFAPIGLSSDHHIPWTIAWSDGEAVTKLVVIFAAAAVILERYIRCKRWLAALLGLCFFHLLLRFAYTLDEPMVEYRTYPSMPWIGLLFAYGVRELTDFRFPSLRWIARPVLGILVVSFATLSWSRSPVWREEQNLVKDVLYQYPLNLRAMGIYFKGLVMRGHPDPVVMGEDMPDMVQAEIIAYNSVGERAYSERRMHLDYASCQYYIIRARLMLEDFENGLAKAQALVDDFVAGRRYGSEDSLSSAYLSLLLCQELGGQPGGSPQTWAAAEAELEDAGKFPEMLRSELILLGRKSSKALALEAEDD